MFYIQPSLYTVNHLANRERIDVMRHNHPGLHCFIGLKHSSSTPLFWISNLFPQHTHNDPSRLVVSINSIHWTDVLSSHFSISFKVKRCFGRVFYHFTIFGFKNAKNNFFEENKRFECSFYRIQVQVIANLLNTKHLTFCLWQIFYEFLKIDNFPNFPKFSEIISLTY